MKANSLASRGVSSRDLLSRVHAVLVVGVVASAAVLPAQSLVRDLTPGRSTDAANSSSDPHPYGVLAGRLVFAANADVRIGREMYVTDGTASGTRLLRDIGPGSGHGIRSFPFDRDTHPPSWVAGGLVFFPADDGVHGLELWCTDGTEAGTRMLADLRPGPADGAPERLGVLGSRLLFTVDDGASGREPWVTDGTVAGTLRLADIRPGFVSSGVGEAVVAGAHVWFPADDGVNGMELWRSDGTPAGTHLVADLSPVPGGSVPRPLCAIGADLLFAATTPTTGRELWRSDGSVAGTRLVADLVPGTGSSAQYVAEGNGTRAFVAVRTFGDPVHLVVVDANGARAVPGIDVGIDPVLAGCGAGVVAFARLGQRTNVWFSDGTTAVSLLSLGRPATEGAPAMPYAGGALFTYGDAANGTQLWWTDGTVAGTRPITDALIPRSIQYPSRLFPFGSDVVFTWGDPVIGHELWRTDGTRSGSSLLVDLNPGAPLASTPTDLARFGDRMLFQAGPTPTERTVWITDGTAHGTIALPARYPKASGIAAPWMLATDTRAMFVALGEPFVTDGTPAGTSMIELMPGFYGSEPILLGTIGDRFVLRANLPDIGSELVVTDGTDAGTTSFDLQPGPTGSDPRHGATFDGRVYFVADDGVHGAELWVTDGTTSGTRMLRDVRPGAYSSLPSPLRVGTTHFYFGATTTEHGYELWRSDGTTAGTQLVFDLVPGRDDGLPAGGDAASRTVFASGSAVVGNRVFFAARLPIVTGGFAWLATDGTANGTTLLPLGPAWTAARDVGAMRSAGDVVYWTTTLFTADGTQRVLAVSDGTAAGTLVLLRLPNAARIGTVNAAEGRSRRVLFSVTTAEEGTELWTSDGTVNGTRPWMAGITGPASGVSGELGRLRDSILLAADDGVTGMELYAMPAGDAGIAAVDTFGSACPSGVAPTFTANGAPAIGASLTLAIDGARALAPGVLLFGARTDLPLGTCRVLVQPSVAIGIVIDATGAARIALPIPQDASLVGALAHTQPAIADPAGALGVVAFGNGLAILIGR